MHHLRTTALAAVLTAACVPAWAQTLAYTPCPLPKTAQNTAQGTCGFSLSGPQIITVPSANRHFQRIANDSATTLTCTRDIAITAVPGLPGLTPGAPGTFTIAAMGSEEFSNPSSTYVPQAATACTPASGTVNGSVETN